MYSYTARSNSTLHIHVHVLDYKLSLSNNISGSHSLVEVTGQDLSKEEGHRTLRIIHLRLTYIIRGG